MDWQGWFSLGLALTALLLMSSGRFAPHLVMMAVLVVLSASGIISADQALAGFSNSGLITVVAMFVVAAGIHHSGGVDLLVNHLLRNPKSVRSAQARIALPVSLLSGFLNNTPVVATMIPAVHAWSRKIGISPSKLMIPLSYSAILGGTLTLIGTSTNLVVNGQYQQLTGEAGFSIFSITAVGLPVAIIGLAVMLLVMPRVLPDRKDQQKFGSMREFTLEVAVSFEGPLVGRTVGEAGLRELERLYLVEIERDGSVVTAVPSEERLRGGDRLVFAGDTQAISDLLRINGIVPSVHDDEPSLSQDRAERRLVEAALSPQSDVLGLTIRDARFRDRYGAVVLAVLAVIWRPLLAGTVSDELAAAEALHPERARLVFMVLMAAVIAIAMKIVGILLITSLLVIPAATARRFARGPEQMALLAAGLGGVSVVAGLFGSLEFDTPSGPSVVVAALLLFLASLLGVVVERRGRLRQRAEGGAAR